MNKEKEQHERNSRNRQESSREKELNWQQRNPTPPSQQGMPPNPYYHPQYPHQPNAGSNNGVQHSMFQYNPYNPYYSPNPYVMDASRRPPANMYPQYPPAAQYPQNRQYMGPTTGMPQQPQHKQGPMGEQDANASSSSMLPPPPAMMMPPYYDPRFAAQMNQQMEKAVIGKSK